MLATPLCTWQLLEELSDVFSTTSLASRKIVLQQYLLWLKILKSVFTLSTTERGHLCIWLLRMVTLSKLCCLASDRPTPINQLFVGVDLRLVIK